MDVEIFFISRHQASDDHILPADKRKSIRLLLEKLKKMYPPIIGEKKEKYPHIIGNKKGKVSTSYRKTTLLENGKFDLRTGRQVSQGQ